MGDCVVMGKVKELASEQIAAVTSLCKAGKSNKEIASITGVSLRSVQRWTKKFRDCGNTDPPLQKKSTGRPRKTTLRTLKVLRRQVDNKPCITAPELKEKNPLLLSHVSVRTVQRRLHDDLKFSRHTARKKPIVTLKQRKNRVAFSKKYLQWDKEKWQGVLWSDEAVFSVTGNRGGKVYRRPGSDPLDTKFIQGTVKYPDKLMVWGAFGYHGVGKLVILPRNVLMNADRYLELLNDNLEDCFEMCQTNVFMQDGAPCHTAKIIKNWFDFVQVDYVKDWPGNSPDLNPIENLWALMKNKLRDRDTSSIPRLEAAIQDIWNNINPQWLQHLAESVPRRLDKCVKREGRPTKY